MILIIPAIRIKNGKCVFKVQTFNNVECTDDPVEMAKLWRIENAKSLHVTDVDGAETGRLVNLDVVKRMIESVDIPIELGGGIQSFDEAQKAFGAGVYRILIGTLFLENPDEAVRILRAFGDSKVVIGLSVENGIVETKGGVTDKNITTIDAALNAKALGFKRIVYRDVLYDGDKRHPNFTAIKQLAETTGMRVTASGGFNGLSDILRFQELVKSGVDSVVIGKALYENKFPCQNIWRLCEAQNYPYTAIINSKS
ncbi:MAG: 1-(5-phosphoribosyl)-5-[(5-phosphoribosylamino)methylideneamino] imidazole-4-carboxamide isomerase [Bacteroidetes bacterium]|nr:1-(5-phosphoribosyl)-5-[(5-phosphoribosylamino)methylideneamino] imidazole-4-carboxamide isomerase [Bacteroidota bacterium]MBU2471713.1 1-(5-phosphoribosyl)-5-[(5-phosphoribosylamino)methylideneamino] imidazole-4-carboxamide isomerase [Bacteroidota bacterium]